MKLEFSQFYLDKIYLTPSEYDTLTSQETKICVICGNLYPDFHFETFCPKCKTHTVWFIEDLKKNGDVIITPTGAPNDPSDPKTT